MNLEEAINKTKEEYQRPERSNDEKEVIENFGYLFNPDNLDNLTKEDFKSFLLIKNNRHWEGIHRQGNMITQDMDKLRKALQILLDESKPLERRLDFLFPKNKPNYIKGLGRAIVTPILMVVYPDRYGVYNRRSAEGLIKIGLEPKFNRGASFSEKYIKVNKVLNSMAQENDMSLFALDEIWWKITEGYKPEWADEEITDEEQEVEALSTGFGLEPHLRRFLVDNWENTPLGKNYEILSEDGEIIGEEYQTKDVGTIDILAKDKNTNDWVVIELKKGHSSDVVTGQILRYIGWVEKNKAKNNEKVKGIIIVKEVDEKLKSALFALKNRIDITCFVYAIKFLLDDVSV